jgi:hypothetical protein
MVECDIRVADELPSYFRHPTMTPYEYFEEMCPLLCTTDVPFDIIGEYMQFHLREFQLSEKLRRLLVGGMWGRQILNATPLLKWYLEHGMVVTKIYQVMAYTPHCCFRSFVKEVSGNRRLGDAHPKKAIIGDTSKFHGNSSFGGTIMDQEASVRHLRPGRGPGHDRGQLTSAYPSRTRRLPQSGKGQGESGHQSTHPDRVLHLTVCEIMHAPVLLRLPGGVRRSYRLCVL